MNPGWRGEMNSCAGTALGWTEERRGVRFSCSRIFDGKIGPAHDHSPLGNRQSVRRQLEISPSLQTRLECR